MGLGGGTLLGIGWLVIIASPWFWGIFFLVISREALRIRPKIHPLFCFNGCLSWILFQMTKENRVHVLKQYLQIEPITQKQLSFLHFYNKTQLMHCTKTPTTVDRIRILNGLWWSRALRLFHVFGKTSPNTSGCVTLAAWGPLERLPKKNTLRLNSSSWGCDLERNNVKLQPKNTN